MKPSRAGTMAHDYERHGATTLFAALNVLEGTIIGRNTKRHRHQAFIRFLNVIDAPAPRRQAIHAIVDNYATRMACATSPLDIPLHPDFGVLAQCRSGRQSTRCSQPSD
jgi:hypothetical protein